MRDMLYPPLLYWSFAWLRFVPFPLAVWIWAGFIVFALVSTLTVLAKESRSLATPVALLSIALLIPQFPSAFAIERANSDALVVVLWTGAWFLARKDRWIGAGIVAGFAVMLKLYPAFAVVVVLAGLSWKARSRFVLGALLAGLVTGAIFVEQTLTYFTNVLPAFSGQVPPASLHSHSFISAYGPVAGPLLSFSLLIVWALASWRRMQENRDLFFWGALAISVFFAGTSYDYNLIVAYPLITLCLLRVPLQAGFAWVSILGVVSLFLFRAYPAVFPGVGPALQWLWLIATAGMALASQTKTVNMGHNSVSAR